jgi:ABC-2 type transport system permease protein
VAVHLLHYRAWRGKFHGPGHSVWPIARLSLVMMFRRKLFWGLYALALFIFFLFFFGQYMLFWAESQLGQSRINVLGKSFPPELLVQKLRVALKLNGTGETYRNLFWYQGYMVMIVLALAGALLVGNDIRHGSLPFYLSKPLAPRHYLLGKCLAITVFVNLLTTLPALCLYVQYGLLDTYDYFDEHLPLLFGILGYGLLLSAVLSLVLVATAVAVKRTVPLIMVWTTLFFLFRQLSVVLVNRMYYDPRWKLMDLWNDLYLAGNALLGVNRSSLGRQPALAEAVLVLGGVSLLCLTYLIHRIRAIEVVS